MVYQNLKIWEFLMSKTSPILNPYELSHWIIDSHFWLIVYLAYPAILAYHMYNIHQIFRYLHLHMSLLVHIFGHSLVKRYSIFIPHSWVEMLGARNIRISLVAQRKTKFQVLMSYRTIYLAHLNASLFTAALFLHN